MKRRTKTRSRKVRANKLSRKSTNQQYKSRRNIVRKTGGHSNADLPHYHLLVRIPHRGIIRTVELNPTFLYSELSRGVSSATVGYIKDLVKDKMVQMDIPEKPFELIWKGKRLGADNTKLRRIVVEGSKITRFHPDLVDPIYVVFDETPEVYSDAFIDSDDDTVIYS
jgi:hypothetical protein